MRSLFTDAVKNFNLLVFIILPAKVLLWVCVHFAMKTITQIANCNEYWERSKTWVKQIFSPKFACHQFTITSKMSACGQCLSWLVSVSWAWYNTPQGLFWCQDFESNMAGNLFSNTLEKKINNRSVHKKNHIFAKKIQSTPQY